MMKTIVLHGILRKQFGERFRVDVSTPAEALRLLDVNFPLRFRKAISQHCFTMLTSPARKHPGCRRAVVDSSLSTAFGQEEIHIRPIAQGRIKGLFGGLGVFGGGAGIGSIFGGGGLLGLGGAGAGAGALGAGGAFGGFGQLLLVVTLFGVAMLLNKKPEKEDKAEKKSFLFDGPINTFNQGGPVPLVYGKVRVGSVVISGGLEVTQTK
jgi:predicted phage tail protein